MTHLIRFSTWFPVKFNPRQPLTGLALKLLAIGALKEVR